MTVTKEYIDSLKNRIKDLEKDLSESENDLRKHRQFWVNIFRKIVRIHGEKPQNSVNTSSLIEDLSRHFNNVNSWWWGI